MVSQSCSPTPKSRLRPLTRALEENLMRLAPLSRAAWINCILANAAGIARVLV